MSTDEVLELHSGGIHGDIGVNQSGHIEPSVDFDYDSTRFDETASLPESVAKCRVSANLTPGIIAPA
jgi:hypothetical protein